jgi:hypothetical protein
MQKVRKLCPQFMFHESCLCLWLLGMHEIWNSQFMSACFY